MKVRPMTVNVISKNYKKRKLTVVYKMASVELVISWPITVIIVQKQTTPYYFCILFVST